MSATQYMRGAVLVLVMLAGCSQPALDREIDWLPSIPLGIEHAEVGQRLFVYFRASWCGVCERLDREVLHTPRIEEVLKNFVPVKIDVDLQPRTATAYLVQALPAFLIIDRSGALEARAIGFLNKEELAIFLRGSKAQ